jgi:enoyl-CoA hydratase
MFLHADPGHPLLAKLEVRKALLQAFDRDRMRTEVFGDAAARARVSSVPVPGKEPEGRGMAGRIARNPPLTVQGVKQVMSFTSEREARLGLDAVALWNAAFFPSEDLQEAIAAFLEKREPTFAGK